MKYIVPAAVTISVGFVVLLSLLFESVLLEVVRLTLVEWVVILAGLAVLVGVLHLLLVHLRKIQSLTTGWAYSLLVVISALIVLVLGLMEGPEAVFESTSLTQLIFDGVLVATQASLAGLILFFLVYAGARMLNKRLRIPSLLFLLVVLIMLFGWVPLAAVQSSVLPGVRNWLLQVPITAGARGILLGVTLGTVVVGLRVLVGAERPYKD